MITVVENTTTPTVVGRSRFCTLATSTLPSPGRPETLSVKTARRAAEVALEDEPLQEARVLDGFRLVEPEER